VAMLKYEEVWR